MIQLALVALFARGHLLIEDVPGVGKTTLARALARDAALVILDEPTSNLDARTEYETFQRFQELTKGRTTVLISHRFSTVRMASRIFVLDEGRIVEQGSFADLNKPGSALSDIMAAE